MANTTSAQKAMRQAERRAIRNQAARAAVRTYFKKATEAVTTTVQEATEVVRLAVSALDRAAQKGIVHPNAAARRKSRLMSHLHRLSVAESQPASASAGPAAAAKGKAPARRATGRGQAAVVKVVAAPRSGARKPAARP